MLIVYLVSTVLAIYNSEYKDTEAKMLEYSNR